MQNRLDHRIGSSTHIQPSARRRAGLLAGLVRLGCARLSAPSAFAGLAIAAAVGAAGVATTADAQLVQRLPSPVSAAEFEDMMRAARIDDAMREVALGLHEEYFKRFREFERNEVEPAMKSVARDLNDRERFMQGASVEEAKREAELRRRLFRSAAQLDGQLIDELTGVLTADQALRGESMRNAMARRRALAAIPRFGMPRAAPEFDLRATSAFTALSADERTRAQPSLDAYDLSLTQLLERMADAALARGVRIAEARAAQAANAGAPEQAEGEAGETDGGEWWRRMREITRTAESELREIDGRLRRLHRDTLGEIEIALSPQAASAMRADLVRGLYPSIASDGAFDSTRRRVESLRAAGKLGESQAAAADAAIAAHDLAARPMLDGMMGLVDELVSNGLESEISFGEEARDPELERIRGVLMRMGADLTELSTRDANELAAAVGLDQQVERDGRGMAVVPAEVFGGGGGAFEGGAVQVSVVVGGPDGEFTELSSDDLGDDMMGFAFVGPGSLGGASSVAPRLDAKALDALAARLGLDGASRPLFDELVARAMEARNEAERAFAQATQPAQPEGEGAGATMSFVIGGPSGESLDARLAFARAIDESEERLFDDFRAVVAADKLLEAESARRARARERLLTGENGAHAADFVAIVGNATLSDASRAALAGELRAWDESSVAALEAMRAAVTESERIQAEALKAATVESEVTLPDGTTQMARTVEFSADASTRLGEAAKRASEARAAVADANRRTRDALLALVAGDEAAAKAVRRGVARAMTPAAYRIPRDLEPFFARALAVEALPASTRSAIDALRAEWIESRESLCEAFVAAGEEPAASESPAGFDVQKLGARTAARRKLRADLEQLEASVHRRLQETLLNEAGPAAAEAIGPLPTGGARRRP